MHKQLSWADAFDEGLLTSYIVYGKSDDANKLFDAEQKKKKLEIENKKEQTGKVQEITKIETTGAS